MQGVISLELGSVLFVLAQSLGMINKKNLISLLFLTPQGHHVTQKMRSRALGHELLTETLLNTFPKLFCPVVMHAVLNFDRQRAPEDPHVSALQAHGQVIVSPRRSALIHLSDVVLPALPPHPPNLYTPKMAPFLSSFHFHGYFFFSYPGEPQIVSRFSHIVT